ncbi:hypothetical protein CDAR_582681 [Caerostris darwini]|uniref:Uncharacterized protein n=1 Tax=Caerostris darwini TaxID=1538125 RepID=A0AAV4PL09_9ARAC|nr:hypothetical protein CDAR_582681 [Caerostris darwini]
MEKQKQEIKREKTVFSVDKETPVDNNNTKKESSAVCVSAGKKMEKHLGPEVASSRRKYSRESGDLLSESCDEQTRENTEGAQEGTAVCGD